MNNRPKPFVIPIFIPHAGCPHRCVFCDQSAITGFRHPPAADEIRSIIHQFAAYNHRRRRPVQAAFFGGNFLGLAPEQVVGMLEATAACARDGLIDSIRFSTRPDTITPAALDLISAFPVQTVEVGVQSMDDAVLALSRRGHTAEQSRTALRLLQQRGLETGAQIMTGLPGDEGPPSIRTGEILSALAPDFVRIYPTVVVAGSVLAQRYLSGDYTPAGLGETVVLVSRLYRIFEAQGVPVIRMGLQATEELDNGATILAGPYHPSFGHLVRSHLFCDQAIKAIKAKAETTREIELAVHPRDISSLKGLRKSNIHRLREIFPLRPIRVVADKALSPGQVICR